jgi:hypothetical protein
MSGFNRSYLSSDSAANSRQPRGLRPRTVPLQEYHVCHVFPFRVSMRGSIFPAKNDIGFSGTAQIPDTRGVYKSRELSDARGRPGGRSLAPIVDSNLFLPKGMTSQASYRLMSQAIARVRSTVTQWNKRMGQFFHRKICRRAGGTILATSTPSSGPFQSRKATFPVPIGRVLMNPSAYSNA